MPEGIWSGTLTFGIVSIPVRVLSAVRSRRSSFHLIHRDDMSRVRRRYYCPRDEEFVDPEEIVRGHEVEDGKYVIIEDEEIESIAPERSSTIEITEFVDLSGIGPEYYDRPYYLFPTGAEKPYGLLADILEKEGRAGIAEFVMQAREHLCSIESVGGVLCLFRLRYPEQLRPAGDIAEGARAKPDLVDGMKSAIKKESRGFDPGKLKDEYQERVDRLIRKKKRSGEVTDVYEG